LCCDVCQSSDGEEEEEGNSGEGADDESQSSAERGGGGEEEEEEEKQPQQQQVDALVALLIDGANAMKTGERRGEVLSGLDTYYNLPRHSAL